MNFSLPIRPENLRGQPATHTTADPDGGSLGRPTSTYTYNAIGQVATEGQPSMLREL